MKTHDDYKRLPLPETPLELCPCCGAKPELWQYSTSETAPCTKVVMCSTSERFGPQDGIANEGCPLYMPPDGHYMATIREAVRYWNEYAKALTAMQRRNRWAAHSALREATTGTEKKKKKKDAEPVVHQGMTIAGDGAAMLGRLMREQRASRLGVYPDGNPNAGTEKP